MRKWLIVVAAGVLITIVALYGLRNKIHAMVLARIETVLRSHFESQIEISDFAVSVFPRIHVTIDGLVMRHKGRTDIPPLIQVQRASVYADWLKLLRHRPHISFMQLEGLQIHTPPRQPGGEPLIRSTNQNLAKKYPVLVEEVLANDAILVILRGDPKKEPRPFPIHHLVIRDLSFDNPAKFQAVMLNAVPLGEIDATGEFGPWLPEVPRETQATGKYIFKNADLGTLKGIEGILTSEGTFSGPLDRLKVDGVTDTPDFRLRTADHPVALHTEFSSIVDGTDGNTYLLLVTAQFLQTNLAVTGKVVDADRQVKGRSIALEVNSQDARVEDLIRLTVKGKEPVMTGAVSLKSTIDIPEGDGDLLDRLKLNGEFGIAAAQFSKSSVQSKLDALSRRAQGQPKDLSIKEVASEMNGKFRVSNAVAHFANLKFGVPGALVDLSGDYNLNDGALDFRGKLILQAKLSQTQTGVKSFFLKAIDPFFKGKDAGAVLPIKISGTRQNPAFGL
jgi:hypothetical protein